jgi:hypothetical protein
MPLFRRNVPVTAQMSMRIGGGDASRSVRSQGAIRSELERLLAILAARQGVPGFEVVDVAVILGAHRNFNGSYATWRTTWDRRLKAARAPGRPSGSFYVDGWAREIPEASWALILIPVAAGTATLVDRSLVPRVKGIAGASTGAKHLRLKGAPLATQASKPKTIKQSSPELMGMDLLSAWLQRTPDNIALGLAPPVLEFTSADHRVRLARDVIAWDLSWPLDAPARGQV